jgi:hypothetical protein
MKIYSVTDAPDAIDRGFYATLREARERQKQTGGRMTVHYAPTLTKALFVAVLNGEAWQDHEEDVE